MRLYDSCNNLLERRYDKLLYPESKPIQFNKEMVRAILIGRKTQTRRKIKTQPKMPLVYICKGRKAGLWCYPSKDMFDLTNLDERFKEIINLSKEDKTMFWKPPYNVNDILYVKETWADVKNKDGTHRRYTYMAGDTYRYTSTGYKSAWRPAADMPKEAARLFLKVTKVSVQHLQEITGAESMKEGIVDEITLAKNGGTFAKEMFFDYWDSTIKKSNLSKYGWETNPWVWVIEFKRII